MPVASSLQTPSMTSQRVETCSVALELGAEGGRVACSWNGKAELLSDSSQHSHRQIDNGIYSKLTRNALAIAEEMLESIIGGDDDTDHGCIKAVMDVMYICELQMKLGRTADEINLREHFPILDKFFHLYGRLPAEDSVLVACHVQHMLLEHLKRLRDLTRLMASNNRCNIKNLISAFPSGWSSWRQKYFAACLQVVWDLPPENVILIHEFEAIANYILCRTQTSKEVTPKSRKMLIISLDEFALNVSTIFAESHNRDPKNFYLQRGQNDAYVHSGIHHHATMVRAAIRNYIQSKRNIAKHEEKHIASQFMASYQATWGAASRNHAFTIRATSSSAVPHEICFNDREARQMHDICFAHILKILDTSIGHEEEELNDMAKQTEVVLTGSGFTNARLRGDVERWVHSRNLYLHDSVESGIDAYKAGTIAVGAAHAIQNSSTVEELMRTACFAIRNSSDNRNSDLIIWRNNSPVSCRIRFLPLEAEEMSVMCSPCPETGGVTSMNIASSYEILKLRTLKPGDYDVRMEYTKSVSGHADQVTVVIDDIHYPTADSDDVLVLGSSHKFQIYFDCGSRLCFQEIDTPQNSVSDLMRTFHPEEPEALRSVTHKDLEKRIRAHMAHRSGCDQLDIEPPACRCELGQQRCEGRRMNSPPSSAQVDPNRKRQASDSASNATRAMGIRNQDGRAAAGPSRARKGKARAQADNVPLFNQAHNNRASKLSTGGRRALAENTPR